MDSELVKLILPKGLLNYFELKKIKPQEEHLEIYLQEKNILPEEFKSPKFTSKGFYDEIKVQDFPLRGKGLFLFIKRRRWLNEVTGEIVHRNWDLVAKGTRKTQEFASFLKVISGCQAS